MELYYFTELHLTSCPLMKVPTELARIEDRVLDLASDGGRKILS